MDVTTAAGFLCFHAGEIPAVDDHVIVHDHDFVVLEADERRVLRMKAVPLSSDGVLLRFLRGVVRYSRCGAGVVWVFCGRLRSKPKKSPSKRGQQKKLPAKPVLLADRRAAAASSLSKAKGNRKGDKILTSASPAARPTNRPGTRRRRR